MGLQSELDTFKNAWLERVDPDTAKLVDQDNLALQALVGNALRAGDRFPAIVLKNQMGEDLDLGELADIQPLVVTFYRGGWCPYCNLELRAYQKALPEIEALGARLVAVTPETPDNSLSTAEKMTFRSRYFPMRRDCCPRHSVSGLNCHPPFGRSTRNSATTSRLETAMIAGPCPCLQPSWSKKGG